MITNGYEVELPVGFEFQVPYGVGKEFVKVKVVEVENDACPCNFCIFRNTCCGAMVLSCDKEVRYDGKDVTFKKVKE